MTAREVLLGADGPEVRVSPRVAARLGPTLVSLLRDHRRRQGPVDPEVAATVAAIDQVGRAYRARTVSSANGTHGIPAEGDSAMVTSWTAAEVAERLGCTVRNVTARAERGTLPARRVAGRWQFDPIDVVESEARSEEPTG